jgi:hypothetical protein
MFCALGRAKQNTSLLIFHLCKTTAKMQACIQTRAMGTVSCVLCPIHPLQQLI